MKIGIIGAGSIGMLFALYLYEDFEVLIYTRTKKQADEINQKGVALKKGRQQTSFPILAMPISKWEGTEDLTIIAVKQYQLQNIIEKMNKLTSVPNNVLFLQNGMGHLKLLETIQSPNVYVGSIEHGALKENAHTVSHNGNGVTNVAVFRGDTARLSQFAALVTKEFPVVLKENYYDMLQNKLIVNAVINPLTAVLGVKNGALLDNQFYHLTAKMLMTEIATILNLEKQTEHFQQVLSICEKTAANRSSMLNDLEAGRPTEVDAILGFLLEEANSLGKIAPLIEGLYNIIKGKELERGELV